MLILAKQPCSQCLCTANRIVPGKRAAEIISSCKATGSHFICHKASDGEIVHCRGVHDLHESIAYRLASAIGIPIVERDMDKS